MINKTSERTAKRIDYKMSMRKLMNIMESVSKKPVSEMVNFGAMSTQELADWESNLVASSAQHGGNSALDDAKRLFVPMHERGREWLDDSPPGARIQDDAEYQQLKRPYWDAIERAADEMDMSAQEVDAIVTHDFYNSNRVNEEVKFDDMSGFANAPDDQFGRPPLSPEEKAHIRAGTRPKSKK
jgi:hypothetical protein